MITLKPITIKQWEQYEEHPDILISQDYDLGQWGYRYEFYRIEDFAYWDALAAYDPEEGKAVAVLSQVIDLDRATEIIRQSEES